MPRGKSSSDRTTLAMALVGYELERQKIDEKIREIRGQLGVRRGRIAAAPAAKAAGGRKRRTLSAAARRRIAAAQRKRWAEHRKKQAQGAKGS